MGVATADAVYATVAAFSLTFLSTFLISLTVPIRLIGGLFLLYLGLKTLRSRPAAQSAVAASLTGKRAEFNAFASAFALTITNPMTILLFAGIFAGANLSTADPVCAVGTVTGVFSGSLLWWFVLTLTVSLLRGRLTTGWMLWINRAAGLIVIAFALSTLAGLITG